MGELASESQGSKELGKTFSWEEGLEAPRITVSTQAGLENWVPG